MADYFIGMPGPVFVVGPLTRTDFVRYAGAAGDFNPLHHDDLYAQSVGNPSVFAHGMFSAGLLASMLTQWFGPDRIARFSVRFLSKVWPGDKVSAEGEIVALEDEKGRRSATVRLDLYRQGGEAAVSGEALVLLPPAPADTAGASSP